ncbi:hypothetical protein NW765_015938 [Fusarium oxysporum]|nr:hypothetical protein NW765_015938 [Fusarium oxysporum]
MKFSVSLLTLIPAVFALPTGEDAAVSKRQSANTVTDQLPLQRHSTNIHRSSQRPLYYQCTSSSAAGACRALADVYYAAVRAFGGGDATPGKRDEDLVKEYEEKVAIYNKAVEEAQAKGELPRLD